MINFKRILLRNYHFSQIVFKNLSWMIFASFIGKLFKFFLMVFLARSFTPSGFGDINYLIVLSAFCFSLSEIGLSMMINREYHQENLPKERLISAGWMLKVLLVISNLGGQKNTLTFRLIIVRIVMEICIFVACQFAKIPFCIFIGVELTV